MTDAASEESRRDHEGVRDLRGQTASRIKTLEEALKPFAAIADEYDADGLDEARPSWVVSGNEKWDPNKELYNGRGGKCLITIADVMRARQALTGKVPTRPLTDPKMIRAEKHYTQLNVGPAQGHELPEARRIEYANRLEQLDREGE